MFHLFNHDLLQDENTLKSKQKEMEKLTSGLESLRQQYEADVEAHAAAQKHFQAVSAGLSSAEDGQSASLQDQLMSKFRIKAQAL